MKRMYSSRMKLNNSGSTLVMTVLAILFISLLASVIMAASVSNVVMKKIDSNSKGTFYTAESVLDEIKMGVGNDSITAMGNAYEYVLANLVETSGSIDYMKDNDTANDMLKTNFMEQMVKNVTGAATDDEIKIYYKDGQAQYRIENTNTVVLDKAIDYLEKYVAKEEKRFATIKSVDNVTIIKDNGFGVTNQIIYENVVVNYRAEKGAEVYYADVTVDINIAYPNMVVDFSVANRLDAFREFALITDGDINVNNSEAIVYASVFSGGNIIVDGATADAKLDVSANGTMASNVVAKRDIIVQSGNKTSNLVMGTLGASNLWCRNLVTASSVTTPAGAGIDISEWCKTIVADDLNIKSKGSSVSIDGEYYGYGYDNAWIDSVNMLQGDSAIVISGEGSQLTMGTTSTSLRKLVLAGHSYIDYDYSDEFYMLGESLSLKTNQEIYLIPSKYIGKGSENEYPNPMTIDKYTELEAEVAASTAELVNLSSFAKPELLATTPYQVRKDTNKNLVYIYFNFNNKVAANSYVQAVINGECETQLKDKMKEFAKESLDAAGFVSIDVPQDSAYVSGSLMSIAASGALSNVATTSIGSLSAEDKEKLIDNYANRYEVISSLLVPIPFNTINALGGTESYYVRDIVNTMQSRYQYTWTGNETLKDTTANIVDWDKVTSTTCYNKNGYLIDEAWTSKPDKCDMYNYLLTVTEEDVTITGGINSANAGIIITKGKVTVKGNFTGLIIAKGGITIENNATITTDKSMIYNLIMNAPNKPGAAGYAGWKFDVPAGATQPDNSVKLKDYFYAYKSEAADGDSIKIENLKYDDIISLDNWRKYED